MKSEKRPETVFAPNEEDIKARILAGQTPADIAALYPKKHYRSVMMFIGNRRRRWATELRWSRFKDDERRTIDFRDVTLETGRRHRMPISLPNITMHRLARQEAAHA